MGSFKGATIALLEARMSSEMASMVQRFGGKPYSVPAVRESTVDGLEQVATFIDHLATSSITTVIFLTGVGVAALMQKAEQLGRLPELLDALRHSQVVCRGPKPSAILKRYNVPVTLHASEPYTTKTLLTTLEQLDLQEKGVAILHYGERNEQLADTLQARKAHIEELCLYQWLLPEDTTELQMLIQRIITNHVDAVVFTSQIQARHLFLIADDLGLTHELMSALNTRIIVASIGPTCTAALEHYGVTPHIIPQHPKMGHLIKALANSMQ